MHVHNTGIMTIRLVECAKCWLIEVDYAVTSMSSAVSGHAADSAIKFVGDKLEVERKCVHHLPVEGVDVLQLHDVRCRPVLDSDVTHGQTCINTNTHLTV